MLRGAKRVIIVPGYGMALAQAQQEVKQLADKLAKGGADVKYAIHPVACLLYTSDAADEL